jgi:hypothetical protein
MPQLKKKIRKCRICGSKENITKHHIYGGKARHRKKNPYQTFWESLGIKIVYLCYDCHKKAHLEKQWVGEDADFIKRMSRKEYDEYIANRIKEREKDAS